MKDFLAITKALSDESRVRALMALAGGELCVCQIIELLGLAPSTVSKHMSVLYQAGMVEARKDGRWMYYRLAEADAPDVVTGALAWTRSSLKKLPGTRLDARRARTVRKMDKGELCCHYK